ncbi:universal stress protein [Actinokineospora guangxiensis]|uniref:Universal stress protein n=1 Tax=Actinokineospora guangxiensis TaxID=1490288 RepID=A0ABW0EPT3_9PSEU
MNGVDAMRDRAVVVGYDASPNSRDAVRWAAREARRTGGPLIAVYSIDPNPVAPSFTGAVAPEGLDEQTLRKAAEQVLGELEQVLSEKAGDIEVRTSIPLGHAAPGLLAVADQENAEVVVVGATGHTAVARAVLGSTTDALLRAARRPVVVARGAGDPDGDVVVGIAGDGSSNAAVAFAAEYATRHGKRLRAVHGWTADPLPGLGPGPGLGAVEVWGTHPERGDEVADELVRGPLAPVLAAHPAISVQVEAVPEPPGQVLMERAASASLLVVGTHGRGALRRMLLGSVSHHAAHVAPCPVAVVHGKCEL